MKHSTPSSCQDMEQSAEHPARKRQRGTTSSTSNENKSKNKSNNDGDGDGDSPENVFDPATMKMLAGDFTIPTIHRCDITLENLFSGSKHNNPSSLPTTLDVDAITQAFEKYQAIYLPQYCGYPNTSNEKYEHGNCNSNDNGNGNDNRNDNGNSTIIETNTATDTTQFRWSDVSDVYENLNERDKQSFCIENEDASEPLTRDGGGGGGNKNSNCFLKDPSANSGKPNDTRVGYCSFMIQNDEEALSDVLQKLPVNDPVAEAASRFASNDDECDGNSNAEGRGWDYEPCLWVFFGRNNSGKDLEGRPEHTDQISHDGTWHYQLSGTKRWLLRPTPQLLRSWKQVVDGNTASNNREDDHANRDNKNEIEDESDIDIEPKQLGIDCREGDVLIVNTRLWRHQTILPPQTEPSVSYARDFWIPKDNATSGRADKGAKGAGAMTNVDGLYAMDDIAEDTVVFREDDMPDCELHRTSEADKANCKIVELEDGMQAVVSSKFIKAGDFFCIPESSDEEDSDDYDEEGEGWSLEIGE